MEWFICVLQNAPDHLKLLISVMPSYYSEMLNVEKSDEWSQKFGTKEIRFSG